MNNWFNNAKILWGIIAALSAGLLVFINLVRSYEPEINRLRLENMVQDSLIAKQKITIYYLDDQVWLLRDVIQNRLLTK